MKVFHALRAMVRPALRWSVPALVIAAPGIAAADDVGHWYITPQIGGISVDNDRPVQDKDWLYGVAIGKHLSQALNLELNLNGSQIGGGPGRGPGRAEPGTRIATIARRTSFARSRILARARRSAPQAGRSTRRTALVQRSRGVANRD